MKLFSHEIFEKKFWQYLLLIILGISWFFFLSNLSFFLSRVSWIFSILQPFILGFAIAFLLNGLMIWFENKVLTKVPKAKNRRRLSVFFTMIITISVIVVLFGFLLPQLVSSVIILIGQVPTYTSTLSDYLQEVIPGLPAIDLDALPLGDALSRFADQYLPAIFSYSGHLVGSFINLIVALVIAVYFLLHKETYQQQLDGLGRALLRPRVFQQVKKVINYGNETFTNFFYGKLLDSLIVGVICFIGMVMLGLPYPLLISVIVGVTNIVPFFGPFIGAIPAILLILAVDPWQALWFGLFILVLQQFDGNILGPLILGDSMGLPPIWVLFAILLGGGMFGFAGMIMGIPGLAMIYKLIRDQQVSRSKSRT